MWWWQGVVDGDAAKHVMGRHGRGWVAVFLFTLLASVVARRICVS